MNPQRKPLSQSSRSSLEEPKIDTQDASLITSSDREGEVEESVQLYYQTHFKNHKAPSIDQLLSSSLPSLSSSPSKGSKFGLSVRFKTMLVYGLSFGLIYGFGFMMWQTQSPSTSDPFAQSLAQPLAQPLAQESTLLDSLQPRFLEQAQVKHAQTQTEFLSYGHVTGELSHL